MPECVILGCHYGTGNRAARRIHDHYVDNGIAVDNPGSPAGDRCRDLARDEHALNVCCICCLL